MSGTHHRAAVPSKSLCPDCGMKTRGNAHVCDPMRKARETRRHETLHKLAANQK